MCRTVMKMRELPLIRRINGFLASPYYIMLVILATAVANLFALELVVYTLFVLAALYTAVLGKDLLPWVPMIVCGYLAPSMGSNPGKNAQSIFNAGHGGEYVLALAAVVVLSLTVYACTHSKDFFGRKRRLLWGLLVLAGAYLLGGLFSPAHPQFTGKNLVFAALQGASLIVPYYVISGGVRWEESRKDYFCWTGFGVGCLLVVEILGIYLTGDIIDHGVIDRDRIYAGWGMYNNMGGLLAMMIPFAFYMGHRYGRGWLGILIGAGFMGGVVMTCSRSSIIMGAAIFLVCLVLMLRTHHTKQDWIALGVLLGVTLVMVLVFRHQLAKMFWILISKGTSLNYRDQAWAEGWKQFCKYPAFGGGFFPIDFTPYDFSTVDSFSGFFPPRWHNTVIQLLASTGIVGLLAYAFHRVQTVRLVLKNRSREVLFIGASMLVLVATCIFDCHFFNIGPVLFYSMGLAFIENHL